MSDNKRFVAYCRVSTGMQGASGLGLEAQEAAIRAHVARVGGDLMRVSVEVESGAVEVRPELERAIDECLAYGATLIVATLDRLTRDVAFLAAFNGRGVAFVCVDFPEASREMLYLMAILASYERAKVSTRTKAALAAKKARGETRNYKLPPNEAARRGGRTGGTKRGKAIAEEAERRRRVILRTLDEAIAAGECDADVEAQVALLNSRAIPRPRGGAWDVAAVAKLRRRQAKVSAG